MPQHGPIESGIDRAPAATDGAAQRVTAGRLGAHSSVQRLSRTPLKSMGASTAGLEIGQSLSYCRTIVAGLRLLSVASTDYSRMASRATRTRVVFSSPDYQSCRSHVAR